MFRIRVSSSRSGAPPVLLIRIHDLDKQGVCTGSNEADISALFMFTNTYSIILAPALSCANLPDLL